MRKLMVFLYLFISGCATAPPKLQDEVKNYNYFQSRLFSNLIYDDKVLSIAGYQIEKRMITSDRLTINIKFIGEGLEFSFAKKNIYLEDENGNKYYVGIMHLPTKNKKINTTVDKPSFIGKVVIKIPNLDNNSIWLYEEENGKRHLLSYLGKLDSNMVFPGLNNEYTSYKEAKKIDAVESYNDFINNYPYSEKKGEIQDNIYLVEFNKAFLNDTIKAYKNFIFKYKNSDLVKVAIKKIKKIEHHYGIAKDGHTVAAYKVFNGQHPKSKFNSELLKSLKNRCKNKKNYRTCHDLYEYLDDFKYLKYASQFAKNKNEYTSGKFKATYIPKEFKEKYKEGSSPSLHFSAALGYSGSKFILGGMYEYEYGYNDIKEAIKWYTEAAKEGQPDAQNRLGYVYYNGSYHVKENKEEAAKWFSKAAEQDLQESQFMLGTMYILGEGGLKYDRYEAFKLFYLSLFDYGSDKVSIERKKIILDHLKKLVITMPDGKYIGDWVVSNLPFFQPEGNGKYFMTNGNEYIGGFLGGNMHGKGTYTWKDGGKYTGVWVNGERKGKSKGVYTWKNGDKYIGDFVGREMTGEGTSLLKNGDKYVGDFVDGEMHGRGTYIWKNGKKYTGRFVQGKAKDNGKYKYVGRKKSDSSSSLFEFVNQHPVLSTVTAIGAGLYAYGEHKRSKDPNWRPFGSDSNTSSDYYQNASNDATASKNKSSNVGEDYNNEGIESKSVKSIQGNDKGIDVLIKWENGQPCGTCSAYTSSSGKKFTDRNGLARIVLGKNSPTRNTIYVEGKDVACARSGDSIDVTVKVTLSGYVPTRLYRGNGC